MSKWRKNIYGDRSMCVLVISCLPQVWEFNYSNGVVTTIWCVCAWQPIVPNLSSRRILHCLSEYLGTIRGTCGFEIHLSFLVKDTVT